MSDWRCRQADRAHGARLQLFRQHRRVTKRLHPLQQQRDHLDAAAMPLEGCAKALPAAELTLLLRHDEQVAVQIEQDPGRLMMAARVVAQPLVGFEADVHDVLFSASGGPAGCGAQVRRQW